MSHGVQRGPLVGFAQPERRTKLPPLSQGAAPLCLLRHLVAAGLLCFSTALPVQAARLEPVHAGLELYTRGLTLAELSRLAQDLEFEGVPYRLNTSGDQRTPSLLREAMDRRNRPRGPTAPVAPQGAAAPPFGRPSATLPD